MQPRDTSKGNKIFPGNKVTLNMPTAAKSIYKPGQSPTDRLRAVNTANAAKPKAATPKPAGNYGPASSVLSKPTPIPMATKASQSDQLKTPNYGNLQAPASSTKPFQTNPNVNLNRTPASRTGAKYTNPVKSAARSVPATPKGSGPSVNRGRTPSRNPGPSASGIRPPVTKAPINTIKAAIKPVKPAAPPAPVGNTAPAPSAPAKNPPVVQTIVDPPSSNPGNAAPTGAPVNPGSPQAPANDPSADPYALFRKEAESIYKPQLDYLTGVETQQTANAATADSKISGMYDGLVKDIRGQQPGIEANYNDSMSQIQGATDQGKAAINANYAKSRSDQAAVLQRLGIQEAAPQTTQRAADDQAYFTSGEDRSNNAYQRMLASQRSSAVDFNTSQANVTGQTGLDQRAGVQKSLQGVLAQLGSKRADAQTNIASQTIGLKKTDDSMRAAKAQAVIDQQIAYDRMANQRGISQDKLAADRATAQVDNGFKQQQIDLEGRKVNNSETMAKNNNAIAAAKLGIERARNSTDASFKQKQLDQALALGQGNLLLGQARLATQDRQSQSAAAAKIAASNQSRQDKFAEHQRNQANLDRTFNAKAPGQSGWKDGPDPWADASKLANSMPRYNGKPSAVENAVGAIRDIVTGRSKQPKGFTDKFDTLDNFIKTVIAHNPQSVRARDGSAGDATNLVSLATYLYPRLYKSSGTRSVP